MEILPKKLIWKHAAKIQKQKDGGKAPLTPAILKEFFFGKEWLNLKPKVTTPTGLPSMKKSHLKMFADVPAAVELVKVLTELDRATKTRSTFVDGFLKHLRPDGKLHPTYYLGHAEFEDADDEESGTVTGRLSAKGPPFQIIPKKTNWAKRIRECYIAPKGKVIVEIDYSQGELKVVACVANEQNMLAAYHQGLDLHAVTGAALGEVPLEEFLSWKDNADPELAAKFEKYRGDAKPANFGLLYGMGAAGFQAYAWANYGLKITLEEAEAMRAKFFELYPGLPAYHDEQRAFVKAWKHVRSPLGRIRHLDAIDSFDREVRSTSERQAINSPIQSCLNDMMLWSLGLMNEAYPGDEIAVFGVIHDAFVAYVDEDKVQLRVSQAKEIMENLPLHELGWEPELKFTSDAKAGPDLAHLSGVKLAA